ncbi:cytochrome P450 [Pseudovirgaria hyperparasitica]|uniref:Cytochrome P450 n=1 Tax=Pseudovirgaria hyperparasitica TaxID=470096 RepID=A0A6A6WB05_9PEZI|nr:cytochrome P450 [Pseudovirgaria hyperparasitica]KAF2759745.1 cytochrome P450 [Pseudovirgaria hyperparasitica]
MYTDALLQSPAAVLGITSVALLIGYILTQAIQRRFFHPFSHVPGPWLNSISEIPAAFHLVNGEQHLYYRSLHEKYGPVVRVSPDELSFVSVEARDEIYGHRKAGLMEKSPIFLGAVGQVNGETGVSLALNAEHTRQRRAIGYIFTNSALLQHESIVRRHIHKWINVLRDAANGARPLDFSDWYTYLAFDIMGDLCFAEPFGCLDQASATSWSTSVIKVFVAATWTQAIRRITGVGTTLETILTKLLIPRRAAEWRLTHLANSKEKTLRRLADPDRDHPDFTYQILHSESKKSLSHTEVILNMGLFISAGTDTTATALAGWTYFVCTHPDVYARLTGEIRSALADETAIIWTNVRHLRYLEATIKEALRLFPPSGASQQRIVPVGGAVIDGYHIPAGKTVAVSPWASTRSSLNFHEPDAFMPERWLGTHERFANDRLAASVPFGNGPRVCVGKNLAYMEMQLVVAHLLWNFDIELDRGLFVDRNRVWGLDGVLKPPKVFHSTMKPELWVALKDIRR